VQKSKKEDKEVRKSCFVCRKYNATCDKVMEVVKKHYGTWDFLKAEKELKEMWENCKEFEPKEVIKWTSGNS
jgi:hypothetical protein